MDPRMQTCGAVSMPGVCLKNRRQPVKWGREAETEDGCGDQAWGWMDGEVCTMKCDPAFKKKGILLYVTTRMNMESIMPSETSHSQKKYCMVPLIWSIKILKLIDTKKRMVVARDWGRRECRVAVQRLWSFSYARWIISRDLMCDTVPVANNTALGT